MTILVSRIWMSILSACFLMAWLPPCVSQAETEKTPKTITVRLTKQQKKIRRLQKGIQGHKKKILSSHEKEQGILFDLENIDRNLREDRLKLRVLQGELDTKEDTINLLQGEYSAINASKERLREHLQDRLASFYRMGSIGYMNVVFSTSSLPDLINFQEHFRLLLRQDQQLINQFRHKISELTVAQEDLHRGKRQMLAVIVDIKDQEQELANSHTKRSKLLNKVKTEKKLYQRALHEMEQAAQDLDQAIVRLKKPSVPKEKIKKKRLASAKKRRPTQGITARKGRLKPPIRGTVTTFFGRNTVKKFGLSSSAKGIDIKPDMNRKKIRAIFSGRVIYAAPLRGYGQMIIIDHGHQYYSLTSRISELKKTKGQLVHGGEIIGTIEEESGLLGEGLHFEIRHGTKPLNPLHWLDNGMLRIKKQ